VRRETVYFRLKYDSTVRSNKSRSVIAVFCIRRPKVFIKIPHGTDTLVCQNETSVRADWITNQALEAQPIELVRMHPGNVLTVAHVGVRALVVPFVVAAGV